jgi:hypothetical protein
MKLLPARAFLAAVRSSDRNLALILGARERRRGNDGRLSSPIATSTIERAIGFQPSCEGRPDAVAAFKNTKARADHGGGNGGTILFYVIERDHDVTVPVEWLQRPISPA